MSTTKNKEDELLLEVNQHYQAWKDDNQKRTTRKNGWNDVTDAYWGKLPDDWPYISKVVDPRIRTSIIEKDARLINSRLRGNLVPREGSDTLSAKLNNTILDYQWENASHGGSMESKLLICSQDTRLYASKFGLVYWKYEEDSEGNVTFEGNEMEPLDIRDCGIDFAATHIRDAKWFQHRKFWYLEDLENFNDTVESEAKFRLVGELKRRMKDSNYKISDKRRNEYQSRIKELKGLEDRLGTDKAFPIVELVTEYRKDRWITFSPVYNIIVRDFDNPYDHGKIPIAQLRYYPLQDDPLGESEVEPVMGLWKAIQAVVCGYLDEMNIKMRPPIKIIEGQARIETIAYGPEAQWLVSRQDAVEEMRSNGEAQRWFQTTYHAMVSAYNTAMGDLSQGISSASPFNADKTATEINQMSEQQRARDQRNQNDLAEFIKDIMSMWLVNNRQFLFSNEEKHEHVLRIVGDNMYDYFKKAGLDAMELPKESAQTIAQIIAEYPDLSDSDIESLMEAGKVPKYPVVSDPNSEEISLKTKMRTNEMDDSAELSIVPQDLEGKYDYVADVKSMSIGSSESLKQAMMQAVEMLTSNKMVIGQLREAGYTTDIKSLLATTLEQIGLTDADRFFQKAKDEQPIPEEQGQNTQAEAYQQARSAGGSPENIQQRGLPETPQANPPAA